MEDNGLVKYYNSKGWAKHLLDANKNPEFYKLAKDLMKFNVMNIPTSGNYYLKKASAKETGAEILLSQIYHKAGFDTALYTPVGKNGFYGYVLSNDVVQNKNIQNARIFTFLNSKKAYEGIEDDNIKNQIINNIFYMPQTKQEEHTNYQDFITSEAMSSLIQMRVFDVASFNPDRHPNNYQFEIIDNKVVGLILFDYGMSGQKYEKNNLAYYNEFSLDKLTRQQFVECIKENENVQDFVSLQECAENIGGIDVVQSARDITEDIGYKFSSKFVSTIAKSYDDMAESLIQL